MKKGVSNTKFSQKSNFIENNVFPTAVKIMKLYDRYSNKTSPIIDFYQISFIYPEHISYTTVSRLTVLDKVAIINQDCFSNETYLEKVIFTEHG